MLGDYRDFLIASTGASAAFIGLLFVALSFIDTEKTDPKLVAWRRIVASSSFAQLVNVFFVSLIGLLPDPHNFATAGVVMAIIGLVFSLKLLPQTVDSERTGRSAPTVLGLAAIAVYALELVSSLGLLHNPDSQRLLDYLIAALIFLYAGALARAWQITGVHIKK